MAQPADSEYVPRHLAFGGLKTGLPPHFDLPPAAALKLVEGGRALDVCCFSGYKNGEAELVKFFLREPWGHQQEVYLDPEVLRRCAFESESPETLKQYACFLEARTRLDVTRYRFQGPSERTPSASS